MDPVESLQQKFQKVLDVVKQDLNTIRTGKASSSLLENVVVEAYGTKMKLMEVATIAASDPTTLLVTPFDAANASAIAKGIQDANLGLTAHVEDTTIRVVVPSLSEERRQEYAKLAKTKTEGGKVMVRQARHEAMEEITKGDYDDDAKDQLEKDAQNLTDKTVEKLDLLAQEKEKELLAI